MLQHVPPLMRRGCPPHTDEPGGHWRRSGARREAVMDTEEPSGAQRSDMSGSRNLARHDTGLRPPMSEAEAAWHAAKLRAAEEWASTSSTPLLPDGARPKTMGRTCGSSSACGPARPRRGTEGPRTDHPGLANSSTESSLPLPTPGRRERREEARSDLKPESMADRVDRLPSPAYPPPMSGTVRGPRSDRKQASLPIT